MVVSALSFGAVGLLYGIGTSSGPISAVLLGLAYGMVGIIVGVPVAALFNITRRLWQ
jgi:hypothetical protein